MTEISIKNFQSIKNISFDIKGFTIIIGKNNIGKSAIIRAVDSVLTNQGVKDNIRKGEKKSEVFIKRDGLDIEWKRTEASSSYKIDGKSYTKLNRNLPQPLIEKGYERIDLGDEKINLHIAQQFKSIFLLNKSGSVVTDTLSELYNLNVISNADELCQKDLRAQKALFKIRESDAAALKSALVPYEEFEELKQEVQQLKKEEGLYTELQQEILLLDSYISQINELRNKLLFLKPVEDIELPDPSRNEEIIKQLDWLNEKIREKERLEKSFGALEKIIEIALPDASDINQEIIELKSIEKYDTAFNEVVTKAKAFNTLKTIDIPSIETSLIEDFSEIEKMEKSFTSCAIEAKGLRDSIRKISEDLDIKQKEKDALEICPLCERPF